MRLSQSIALLVALLASKSQAQIVGQDVCACFPPAFDVVFDFSLSCPPVNITRNGGVAQTSCRIESNPDGVVDLVPIIIENVNVLEVNSNNDRLNQRNITQNFADGDSYRIESTTLDIANINDTASIPVAIQVSVFGKNAAGDQIINDFSIVWSNDCAIFPVMEVGNSAGWVRFSGLDDAQDALCPATTLSAVPTIAPTMSPSDTPTMAPTLPPTLPPATGMPTFDMSMSFSMSMALQTKSLFDLDASDFDDLLEFGGGRPAFQKPEWDDSVIPDVPRMKEDATIRFALSDQGASSTVSLRALAVDDTKTPKLKKPTQKDDSKRALDAEAEFGRHSSQKSDKMPKKERTQQQLRRVDTLFKVE